MNRKAHCADCKQEIIAPESTVKTGSGGTGYETFGKSKRKVCYACCSLRDRKSMIKTGKATLYLSGCKVTNWPGTLCLYVNRQKNGSHNIAGNRIDVWFRGPENATWHGIQYGSNTQILHCKRLQTG